MLKRSQEKIELLRWSGWFFVLNIPLFWLIALRYLPSLNWLFDSDYEFVLNLPDRLALVGYLIICYLGYLSVLAFLPCIVIGTLIIIYQSRPFVFGITSLLATFSAGLLMIDTIVYQLFHFHLNGILFNLFIESIQLKTDFFNLSPKEIQSLVGIFVGLLLTEIILASLAWKAIRYRRHFQPLGSLVATFIALCLFIPCSIFIPTINVLKDNPDMPKSFGHVLVEASRILPLYDKFLGVFFASSDPTLLTRLSEKKYVQPTQVYRDLDYPLSSLQFKSKKHLYNIVIIVIDAWRFDMLNPITAPNLYQFSKKSHRFNRHFSGGNSTQAGIFSLFYSIPSTYWSAMEKNKRGPVLIDELLKKKYQVNALASAGLRYPAFNRTVFKAVENVQANMPGDSADERDRNVTLLFQDFLGSARQKSDPFFSFLFYDSTHAYCQIDNVILTPFQPIIEKCDRTNRINNENRERYLNRYKNSLRFVDEQIKLVLDSLKNYKLLENTIIIITGDHGEEFGDTRLGLFGHGSNFTHYQVQTPLIVYWPDEKPKTFDHLTTHYDIVPTLMEKALGCNTIRKAYSIGGSLFDNKVYPYLIAGSYIGLGIIEQDRITNIFPTGHFQMTDPNGNILKENLLQPSIIQEALEVLTQFYK